MHKTDIVVIGAGPVGLFSVFECGMLGMKAHVIDAMDVVGGQCSALYPEKPIYDIPAHPVITGAGLIENLKEQIKPFDPVFHLGQSVVKLQKKDESAVGSDKNKWIVETSKGEVIETSCVIIAAGVGAFGPNKPPLNDIEYYEGKSVFYYIQNKEQFRDKNIVIAGGGDSALDWAIVLSDIAKKVYVVHRRDKFRAAPETVARMQKIANDTPEKLEIVTPYQLFSINGDKSSGTMESITLSDLDGNKKELKADVLLPFFGLATDLGPIASWGLNINNKHISVDQSTCSTNFTGIFAIGDVATYEKKIKLILTGFAEAAQAAYAAREIVFPGEVFHFEYSTTSGVPELKTSKSA